MRPLVTILYEDSRLSPSRFALHELVIRLVADRSHGEFWKFTNRLECNPRNGVDNVLSDLRNASLIAGEGRLFVLLDRDRIIKHLNNRSRMSGGRTLPPTATDDQIVETIRLLSDAPERVRAFLLHENVEGVVKSIADCAPSRWQDDVKDALRKVRLAREAVLSAAARAHETSVRDCLRQRQPGLSALADALSQLSAMQG
ncbi:MAG: hypothetical protein KGO50_05135 [Myxococcales bacterium]|nr:hypothetical protein [Myxococcales bacterium]